MPFGEGVPQAHVSLSRTSRKVLFLADASLPSVHASCTFLPSFKTAGKEPLLPSNPVAINTHDIVSILEESLKKLPGFQGMASGKTFRLKEGERRRIAVLFLDIEGFTGLSETLDHEEVHSLVSGVMGVLSRVVESYGGYVDKFEGDRIMALFGAIAAAENDSARAVDCALRMLDVLEDIGPVLPDGSAISARIGIDFGPVTVGPDPSGHFTAIGMTANLASRVEELAEVGTVLVTGTVRDECGTLFSWHDLGEVLVRGVSDPVQTFRPTGPGDLRFERWNRAERLSGAPLVGRADQLAVIRGALDAALGGEDFSFVMVTGEAGIGKSRLVHEFLAGVSNVDILRGHALAYAQPSYWLWISMIREYLGVDWDDPCVVSLIEERIGEVVRNCPDERLGRVLSNVTPILSRLIALGETGFSSGSVSEHSALLHALKSFLDVLCATGSVIIVLEDLHWADEASLNCLTAFLSAEGGTAPVEVVATSRPPCIDLPDIDTEVIRVELGSLARKDASALAGFLLSSGEEALLDHELLQLIVRLGKGNPFIVEELVLSLLDTGGLSKDDSGKWWLAVSSADIEIPSSVRSFTQARIDLLPFEERQLLQYCSVLGVSFWMELLLEAMRILSLEVSSCSMLLSNLVRKGFLVEVEAGRYSFRHALVQRSVHGTILKHNLRILHRASALAIEELYPHEIDAMSPVILSHWERTNHSKETILWTRRAMSSAYGLGRPKESIILAEKLLELTDDCSDDGEDWEARMQAYTVRHSILSRRGDVEKAFATVDEMLCEARARSSIGWEIKALRARAIMLHGAGRNEEFEETLELAMEKAEKAGEELLLARLKGTLANYYSDTFKGDRTLELYLESLETLRKHDKEVLVASALTNVANLCYRNGELELAAEYYKESVEVYEKLCDTVGIGFALNGLAIIYARLGQMDRAEEMFLRALNNHRDTGSRVEECAVLGNLGIVAKQRGDYDCAIERYERALGLAVETKNLRTEAINLVNLGILKRITGHFDEAVESCTRSLEISARFDDPLNTSHAISVIGMTFLDAGEPEKALESYDRVLDVVEKHSIRKGMVEDFDQLLEALESRGHSPAHPSNWADEEL